MLLAWSRYSALLFAMSLGIGEAVINWGHWQYAPLWIVDYVIAIWLICGFVKTRSDGHVYVLASGWAFSAGVFYMALFISLDPKLVSLLKVNSVLLMLMSFMLAVSIIGFVSAAFAMRAQCSHVKALSLKW